MPNSAVRELRQAHPISSDYVTPLGPFVLFGSDDPTVTAVGTGIFRGAGYRVRAARVERLTTRHLLGSGRGFPGEAVELVVLDASKEPERALAVLEALRDRDPTLPVILIADSDPGLRDEAARLGADALVDVPLEMAKLRGVVQVLTPFVPDFAMTRTHRSNGRPH